MIFIDYNQFILAAIFNSLREGFSTKEVVDINIVRHYVLNQIRSNRKKFKNEYGELVICCDSSEVWRKDFFPYYKIRRSENRKANDLDWSAVFKVMEQFKQELIDNFPYKVINVAKCEADDIIGVLCHHFGSDFFVGDEKHLILSRDKDYKQLQKFANIFQYDQYEKKFITVQDPETLLLEMIITGDSGDDIPNVLSDDNVFAIKKRQTVMTAKRREMLMNGQMDEDTKIRWERNKTLIDLSMIPDNYKTSILEAYENAKPNKRGKLMNYFFENGLTNLMEDIGDF